MANSDMRDESIYKATMHDFHWPFYLYYWNLHNISTTDWYISSYCFSRCQYVPETLIQPRNNMGIIGNDMSIK